MNIVQDPLENRLAVMVAAATDDQISADDVLAARHSLAALGVTSLSLIRLVDAIEDEFGVDVDPGLVDDFANLVADVAGRLR
ncbi:acyl carrier protein [Acrocarpospora macrocephala]|uniref:acyl carrier protein n=1 Tax=Acrocarpospora macrocephala TaxID=150177 RepID=UPI0012D346FF|nr:acyl carrier protein [Acrocarpospora macrocephala]